MRTLGSRDHPGYTSGFPAASPHKSATDHDDTGKTVKGKGKTWMDTFIRIAEAMVLVTVTSLAAIFLPGITVIFGLTGSVTATAIM